MKFTELYEKSNLINEKKNKLVFSDNIKDFIKQFKLITKDLSVDEIAKLVYTLSEDQYDIGYSDGTEQGEFDADN